MSDAPTRVIVTVLLFMSIGVMWSYVKAAWKKKKYLRLLLIVIVWCIVFAILAVIKGVHSR